MSITSYKMIVVIWYAAVYNVFMTNRLVEWIEAERARRGWSVRQLARRAQLTPVQVSDVLNQKSRPGLRFYLGMWKAFGVSVDFLLGLAGELPLREETPTLSEIVARAKLLPPDLQEDLLRYVDWRSQQAGAAASPAPAEPYPAGKPATSAG